MYKVWVVSGSADGHFGAGYFPRKFRYLKDAKESVDEALRHGATRMRIKWPNGAEQDVVVGAKVKK